ncbi:ATP-grasp domain-containing protein [Sporofaciens sp. JLR.KK001]|uniref:ATP-grasp domain-containing protein n=1 Tax=Sporofaciens sp. JLR.KK001 TaxID=3112621 RepID=UPI002FEEC054
MNIMLTSAGRRAYMVNYFKNAVKGKGKVYVGNCDENAVSFLYADETVITPYIYEDGYIDFLIDYCECKNITLVIPLFDIDLYILSMNKAEFEKKNIHLIVSDISVIEICNDKWKMKCFLEENEILTPKTYLKIDDAVKAIEEQEIKYPLIIKPRWGMGSIGVYEADNLEELKILYSKTNREIKESYLKYESKQDYSKSVLIQEKIIGEEYGGDIINDLKGRYQNTIAKKKYSMRAGETDIAIITKNYMIENLGMKIGKRLNHIANLDADFIVTDKKETYVIDLNARFGGGYPFSHCAGVDLPKAIIMWLQGEQVQKELLLPQFNIKGYKEINVCK